MKKEFTGNIIDVDIRTVDDVSYFSKVYPHPLNHKKKVVITEFSFVNPDKDEEKAGLQTHYWVRGETLCIVNIASQEEIRKYIEYNRKGKITLPIIDGIIRCKEYTNDFSQKIKLEMIKKGILS
ncbi:MAG: hypothetical protein QXK49_02840 [Candidatus Aenigmatarchaeota archaeon]